MKLTAARSPARPSAAAWSSARGLKVLGRLLVYALLIVGSLMMLVPFFWMLSSSLKSQSDIFLMPPQWIPTPPLWSNYATALTVVPFQVYFLNTLKIEIGVIVGTVVSSAMPAYSFARLRWPGRDWVFYLLLAVLMLPGFVTLVPTFILWSFLHGVNTFWPLILPAWFGNAFYIFLLRQFFLTLPTELDDAAKIDGANPLGVFWRIVLPLAKPALATVAIFSFVFRWNDFFGPLIYLSTPEQMTIAVGLQLFRGQWGTDFSLLMAASTVAVLPVILLFFFAQKTFVQGIALTGMKG